MDNNAKVLWVQVSEDAIQGIDGSISLLRVLSEISSNKFPFKIPQLFFSASILSGESEKIKKQKLTITNNTDEVLYSNTDKNISIPKDSNPLNATKLIPPLEISNPGVIFVQFKITFDNDTTIESNKLEIHIVETKANPTEQS